MIPSRRDMLAFLTSGELIDAAGRVLSWLGVEQPGYPYPEAAALLLRYLTLESHADGALRARLAARLAADISERGGVGKAGREYTFDAAIALAALRGLHGGTSSPSSVASARLAAFVRACLARQSALGEGPGDAHWSRAFGGHLLKACGILHAYAASRSDLELSRVATTAASSLLDSFDGRRFPVHRSSALTYCHAHGYALEGLAMLRELGWHDGDRALHAGVAWLAEIADPCGGIPAWFGPEAPRLELRTDATAQAVRLWVLLDPRRYAPEIARSLEFLATHQLAHGGIAYGTEIRDGCTWSTVFTAQATAWASSEVAARPLDLV